MLTGDLLLARTKAKDIYAATLDVDHAGWLERAGELIALVEQALAEGWTRGELVARSRDLEGTDTDHKITRGLAKVLMDRCTF
jgi:predicted nuclease of restriction endonuclease-like RecB superfamily